MSLPLPPEFWPLQPDDVVVLIEGVAFIETKEEAARLVAEGKAQYPEWNPDDPDYDIEESGADPPWNPDDSDFDLEGWTP